MAGSGYDQPVIIIKKVKKAAHAHHGGAWKIAYADFVTAMMAFFLLLWLISMTTPEQKEGLASYFAPPNVSPSTSGAGGLMGGTAIQADGAQMAGTAPDKTVQPAVSPKGAEFGMADGVKSGDAKLAGNPYDEAKSSQLDMHSEMDLAFQSAAASIEQAWRQMPNITQMADNLLVTQTEKGLSIVISDQEGRPMFPEGSKYPYEVTRQALAAIAPQLAKLPNQIDIVGHAAAGATYADPRYGAWELTSDRANVVRGILAEFGLPEDHIHAVVGRASTDPFFPNDPYLTANERIEITVLYDAPPVPPDLTP